MWLIDEELSTLVGRFIILDDVLIYGKIQDEPLMHLQALFNQSQLLGQSMFFQSKLEYLAHVNKQNWLELELSTQ